MEALYLQNQLYAIAIAILNIPYLAIWLTGFTINMCWLLCMFNIVYESNIYNDVLDKKYFNSLTVIVLQVWYLFGILTWNPLIICAMIYHSSIVTDNIDNVISKAFINLLSVFDIRINYNVTAAPEQDEPEQDEPEHAEHEQDEPEQAEHEQDEPEQAEPEQAEPEQAEPEQDEPEQAEPEQDEPEQAEPDAPMTLEQIRADAHEQNETMPPEGGWTIETHPMISHVA